LTEEEGDEMEVRGRTACWKETTQRARRQNKSEEKERRWSAQEGAAKKKAESAHSPPVHRKKTVSTRLRNANKNAREKLAVDDAPNRKVRRLNRRQTTLDVPPAFSSRYEVLDGAVADG
jgi:hypothetical protein